MRMKTLFLFPAALIALATPVFAQFGGANYAAVTAAASPATVKPGGKTSVVVTIAVNPGFHINAAKPADENLIPTKLTLTVPAGFRAGATAYPKSQIMKAPALSDKPLLVYMGKAQICVPVTAVSAKPGHYTLTGMLQYQGCNANACFPPQERAHQGDGDGAVRALPACRTLPASLRGRSRKAPLPPILEESDSYSSLLGRRGGFGRREGFGRWEGSFLLALTLLLLSFGLAIAAPATPAARFTTTVTPMPVRPGEIAAIRVTAMIGPEWHLYSLTPTPPPGPSPTQITVTGKGLTLVGAVTEDTPIQANDPNFGKEVAYHENTATFTVPARVAAPAQAGTLTAQVTIHYQTCNDKVCLPPMTQALTVPLAVQTGPARAEYSQAPHADAAAAPTQTKPSSQPLLPFLGGAFLAGLLALLTPCVFPLIPVTFGFFTKQVGGEHRKLIALASTYALGIIAAFTLLGIVMTVVLGAAGANRVAANPWFNLAFGVLFVVFAFSFFETLNLQLPPSLSRLAAPVQRSGGIVTALLMGLAFVFAAFTCTAPFIGTVLVTAASATTTGAWARPLLGMMTFAFALALPFFLLAFFPQLLAKLPKSGGWLSRTKAILGFVELTYALLYFSKADLVWHMGVLTRPALLALWTAIAWRAHCI